VLEVLATVSVSPPISVMNASCRLSGDQAMSPASSPARLK
jgi:hypothetical protein